MNRTVPAVALLALLLPAAPAQDLGTLQAELQVVTNVALATDAGPDGPRYDLLLAAGHLRSIEPTGGELPAGARQVDGTGLTAWPAFLDAWSFTGCETPAPVAQRDLPIDTGRDVRAAMRDANRKGLQPGFRAADVVDLGADGAGAWRAAGFGTLLVAPTDELIAGRGALVAARAGTPRELVLSADVFQHGTFAATGRGFPSTMMGYFAQLRQFFYDVDRQVRLAERYDSGRPDPRPAWDPDLEAAARLVEGRELYVVHADRASDIERWLRLADEFGLRIAIAGGREAWRHAELLAERKVPVFLDLDWGEEVEDPTPEPDDATELVDGPTGDVEPDPEGTAMAPDGGDGEADEAVDPWHYAEPLGVREERRRRWEETRAGALVLAEAGVQVLFGTGDRQPKELVAGLRELAELGLERERLTAALTSEAARFLGVGDHLGELAVGRDATFCLWTDHPLAEGADLAAIFVDGVLHEFDVEAAGEGPAEGVDATGTWTFTFTGDQSPEGSTARLAMAEDGGVSGSYNMVSVWDDEAYEAALEGRVEGTLLTVKGVVSMGEVDMTITLTAELTGDALSGEATWAGPWGEETDKVSATREPDRHDHEHLEDEEYTCH